MSRFYEPDLGTDPIARSHGTPRISLFVEAIGWT